ncbi:MAG: Fe-S cluster assembly protein SufD [Chloroflexi bacterium]|nr:Fe-S cluster assembly protein SufD [Chloroflexota bacterium]
MTQALSIQTQPLVSAATVEQISNSRNEPAWLRKARAEAWAVYEQTPMPTLNDELWRRTDISTLKLDRLSSAFDAPSATPTQSVDELPEGLKRMLDVGEAEAAGYLAQVDGGAMFNWLNDDLRAQGVIFTDLETAAREHAPLLRDYFMTSAVPPTYGKFEALHGALWTGGVFLYVPQGVKVALPFRAGIWQQTARAGLFPHTLIIADAGSEVTYIEAYGSETQPEPAMSDHAVELFLKEGANLTFVTLQNWGRHTYSLGAQRAMLDRDATLQWVIGTLGSKVTKTHHEIFMLGPGSTGNIHGFYFADANQHLDHHTQQDHFAGHSTTDLLFKGVLKDKARTIYQGLIHVHKNAQRSDAYQANRNLNLSARARADSIPGLEIEANDVRCTHGATVGQVDDEQMFYLRSRGLSEAHAQRLIVEGFFEPLMDRIPLESARVKLREAIQEKLGAF